MKILSVCFLLLCSNFIHGQPKIKFDSTEYTLRSLKQGIPAYLKIRFQNTGNQPLIITNANGSGPPSVTRPIEPVMPDKTGYIEVGVFTGAPGKSRQPIYVSTNINDSITVIPINIEVIPNDIERMVSGVVKDTSGRTLSYVNVSVQNSYQGTQTNRNGLYSILAKPADTLTFGYVGFYEQKTPAWHEKLDIVLVQLPPFRESHRLPRSYYVNPGPEITAIDIKNIYNPKYNFQKNAGQNLFILYLSSAFNPNKTDSLFQVKYNVRYSPIGHFSLEYAKKYNQGTIRHLYKTYKKDWKRTVRKNVIGLKIRD